MSIGGRLAETVRSYVGTKWVHQGRTPGIALDCAGMIVCAANELNVPIDIPTNYARRPRPNLLQHHVSRWCDQIEDADEVGAIHLMRPRASLRPSHFAVTVAPGKIVHAVYQAKVDETAMKPWRDLIVSSWRLRGG